MEDCTPRQSVSNRGEGIFVQVPCQVFQECNADSRSSRHSQPSATR